MAVPGAVVVAQAVTLALALALSACGLQNTGGGAGLDFGTGHVWECEVEDASQGFQIVDLEVCWKRSRDDLELALWDAYGDPDTLNGYATCRPTQRHAGPCWYRCPGGKGCNAFHGCLCL